MRRAIGIFIGTLIAFLGGSGCVILWLDVSGLARDGQVTLIEMSFYRAAIAAAFFYLIFLGLRHAKKAADGSK